MRTFLNSGNRVPIIFPYAAAAGGLVLSGSLFGVATRDTAKDDRGDLEITGSYSLPKTPGEAVPAVGTKLYFDPAIKALTVNAAAGKPWVATSLSPASADAATVDSLLSGVAI
ncbi:capsid cement protein [Sphingomonas panni]